MTPDRPAPDLGWLDELERLRAAATPGPWTADGQVILQPEGYSEWPVVACDYGVVKPQVGGFLADEIRSTLTAALASERTTP